MQKNSLQSKTTVRKFSKVMIPTYLTYDIIDSFKADYSEVNEFLRSLESAIYDYTIEYIHKLFFDINPNLIRKFNKLFKKDEQDKNRDWRAMEET